MHEQASRIERDLRIAGARFEPGQDRAQRPSRAVVAQGIFRRIRSTQGSDQSRRRIQQVATRCVQ